MFRIDETEISKHSTPNDSNLELHNVTGQSPSFITKDILDLTQLLVQRSRFHVHELFPKLAVHQFVTVYKDRLRKLDHLDGNNQRNWNHGVDQDEIREKGKHPVHKGTVLCPQNVRVAVSVLASKEPG